MAQMHHAGSVGDVVELQHVPTAPRLAVDEADLTGCRELRHPRILLDRGAPQLEGRLATAGHPAAAQIPGATVRPRGDPRIRVATAHRVAIPCEQVADREL